MFPPKHSTFEALGDLSRGSDSPTAAEALAWYCIRALPKSEHIAAAQLRQQCQLEVFLPRIRFRRATRSGPAWVTEALFAGYLFARFSLSSHLRWVQSARGVRAVVHFGDRWPTIPVQALQELHEAIGPDDVKVFSPELQPGDTAEIAGGIFSGLNAVVIRALPGRQRVAVLLDFLGRQTTVEVNQWDLIANRSI